MFQLLLGESVLVVLVENEVEDLFRLGVSLLVYIPYLPGHIPLLIGGNIMIIRKHHQALEGHHQVFLVVVEGRVIVAFEPSLLSHPFFLMVLRHSVRLHFGLTAGVDFLGSSVEKWRLNVNGALMKEVIDED
jgi:hypothetical protein